MSFDLILSFNMAIFGGAGTILGPMVGAAFMSIIIETLWTTLPYLYAIIFGLLVVAIVILSPGGLMELWGRVIRSHPAAVGDGLA